jgi:hypothetical protein
MDTPCKAIYAPDFDIFASGHGECFTKAVEAAHRNLTQFR